MTVEEAAPSVGGVPSGYRVGPVVGRGTSSEIRLAVQTSTHRVVALKLLHADLGGDAAWRRFESERRALGELSHHPHIVTVVDAGMAGDRPWIAMEYCSRGSFAGPGPGAIGTEAAVAVLAAVASALAAAHAADIRHGDVKPANIMLTDSGAPALADFGLARLAAARSAGSSVRGYTPDHVPPELLDHDDRGLAGDVYSLGTTVWQLLAGRPPFRTDDDDALAVVMMRILRDPLPELPRDDVPSWLVELLAAMTAKDPQERPTATEVSARVAGHEAQAWALVSPPGADTVGAADRGSLDVDGFGASQTAHVAPRRSARTDGDEPPVAPARPRRRPLILTVAAVVAMVALLVVAVLTVPRHRVVIGPAAADSPVPTGVAPPSAAVPTAASAVVPSVSASVPVPAGPTDDADHADDGSGDDPRAGGGSTGSGAGSGITAGGGDNTADNTADNAGNAGGNAAAAGPVGDTGGGAAAADDGTPGAGPSPAAIAPDAQTAPQSEPIGGWRSFGGAGLSAGTGSLTITAPVNDYSALRGAFAPVDGCDYEVAFDASTTPPSGSSPGYGYAVGVRSGLVSGVPQGWSMQYDWDGAQNQFFHRVAVLPADAYRSTNGYADSAGSGGSHHTVVRVQGSRATVSFDGEPVGSGSFGVGGGCGSGIVLRVWSASVQFRNVTLTSL